MKYVAMAVGLTVVSGQANARMSFIEAFAESNDSQCIQFQFEGAAFYSKISFSIFTGVAINFYLSPITAHYNPDFLVSSYSRLGESPLFESYLTMGYGQNLVAKPMVELLSGASVPETWFDTEDWSGQGSDVQRESHSTLQYFESEVFGHPGNVYTWASKAFRGELKIPTAGLELLTAIPTDIAQVPTMVNEAIADLGQLNTELDDSFSDDAKERISPVKLASNAIVGELIDLANNTTLGKVIKKLNLTDTNPGALYTKYIAGTVNEASAEAVEDIDDSAEDAVPEEDPDDEPTRLSFEGLTDKATDELRERFGELSVDNIKEYAQKEVDGAVEKINEVAGLFSALNTGALADFQSFATPGVGFSPIGFKGFCPSDSEPFRPYYLSGTNILAWRFTLPELVYPQTYIPFSNKTTIGELLPDVQSNVLEAIKKNQNYGSVYPRNGYILQADPVKAAAAIAFRSAHVVTRPGQPHLYRSVPALGSERFTMFDNGYDSLDWGADSRAASSVYLEPHLDERGRWQLLYSKGVETENSCHRFGSPEVNPELTGEEQSRSIGDVTNVLPVQWTEGKASESNDYLFGLWRRYRCAPKPGGSLVNHLGNFTLPSPITLIE